MELAIIIVNTNETTRSLTRVITNIAANDVVYINYNIQHCI